LTRSSNAILRSTPHRPAPASTGPCGRAYYDQAIGICFGHTWHSARRHAGRSRQHRPSTSQAPAKPKAPTATDVVAAIQKGQSATTSLSHADGTSPDAQLTPQALAEMSEEQFEALYNEIMEKGDRKKLMDLFGH
jgi:hypothetical protein